MSWRLFERFVNSIDRQLPIITHGSDHLVTLSAQQNRAKAGEP
jgi:hypothetical protein